MRLGEHCRNEWSADRAEDEKELMKTIDLCRATYYQAFVQREVYLKKLLLNAKLTECCALNKGYESYSLY